MSDQTSPPVIEKNNPIHEQLSFVDICCLSSQVMRSYIMKFGAIVLSVILTIMSITPALASGGHGRGHHYNKHHHGDRHSYSRHGHGYSNHYSYRPHRRHYSHYDSHGAYAAYALGGLVVGGILGATLNNSYNSGARYSNYNEPVYANRQVVNQGVQPSYMMQPDGTCYLVSHVSNGNLVLSPAAQGNCR